MCCKPASAGLGVLEADAPQKFGVILTTATREMVWSQMMPVERSVAPNRRDEHRCSTWHRDEEGPGLVQQSRPTIHDVDGSGFRQEHIEGINAVQLAKIKLGMAPKIFTGSAADRHRRVAQGVGQVHGSPMSRWANRMRQTSAGPAPAAGQVSKKGGRYCWRNVRPGENIPCSPWQEVHDRANRVLSLPENFYNCLFAIDNQTPHYSSVRNPGRSARGWCCSAGPSPRAGGAERWYQGARWRLVRVDPPEH